MFMIFKNIKDEEILELLNELDDEIKKHQKILYTMIDYACENNLSLISEMILSCSNKINKLHNEMLQIQKYYGTFNNPKK